MPFRRWLNDQTLNHLTPVVTEVLQRPDWLEWSIELRTDNRLIIYRSGQKAAELRAPLGKLKAKPFGGAEADLANAAAIHSMLDDAHQKIQTHLHGQHSPGELQAQASLVRATQVTPHEFVIIDQQIAFPADAVLDSNHAQFVVDLLALHPETGRLWLIELKLAQNLELDGDVLDQVTRMATFPDELQGGRHQFIEHYREVVKQKVALGLLPATAAQISGEIQPALIIIGDAAQAQARIACWEDDRLPPATLNIGCAIVQSGALPLAAAFVPLEEARTAALHGNHDPYAPRRSRWTDFASQEQTRQNAWLQSHASAGFAGPRTPQLKAYLQAHDAPAHQHLSHVRSSQAACLQLFGALRVDEPTLREAFVELLSPYVGRLGAEMRSIVSVDFEAPHRRCHEQCTCPGNMAQLAGEVGGLSTRLDAFLRATVAVEDLEQQIGIGIEFKYTEPEFTSCGGFVSRGNSLEGKRACLDAALDRRGKCYLLQQHGRRYLNATEVSEYFKVDPLVAAGPCELLGPQNQLYRAHYTTRKLSESLGCADGIFIVVHDARNPDLLAPEPTIPGFAPYPAGPLDRYREALTAEAEKTFGVLTLQTIAARLRMNAALPKDVGALLDRYGW